MRNSGANGNPGNRPRVLFPTTVVIPLFPRATDFARLNGPLFYEVPGFNMLHIGSGSQLRHRVFGNAMGRAICQKIGVQQRKI